MVASLSDDHDESHDEPADDGGFIAVSASRSRGDIDSVSTVAAGIPTMAR